MILTTLSLVLNRGNSTLLPPVNGRRDASVLIHEASTLIGLLSMEHPVVADLRSSKEGAELMVGKISKLVQLELVRLVHAVHLVHMLHVLLEHIESLVLVIKAP